MVDHGLLAEVRRPDGIVGYNRGRAGDRLRARAPRRSVHWPLSPASRRGLARYHGSRGSHAFRQPNRKGPAWYGDDARSGWSGEFPGFKVVARIDA